MREQHEDCRPARYQRFVAALSEFIGGDNAGRPSNTRAPVQVTAKALNNNALARSNETRSGTAPYMPNSTTEAARNKCAKPHHATAVIAVFYTHANSSSNPRIAST